MNENQKRKVQERLLKCLSITTSGCWEFTGHRNSQGYGYVRILDKTFRAHRVSYQYFKGEIPDGFCVCHSCDNPPCCNPDHLWAGTRTENIRDASKKGRLSGERPNAQGEKHGSSILRDDQVLQIVEEVKKGRHHQVVADEFGISRTTIFDICRGKSWSSITGIPKRCRNQFARLPKTTVEEEK